MKFRNMGMKKAVAAALWAMVAVSTYSAISSATKKQPEPPKLPKAPTPEAAEGTAKEQMDQKRRAIARGGQSIYTNPLGIGGQAQVAKKTLLGQ